MVQFLRFSCRTFQSGVSVQVHIPSVYEIVEVLSVEPSRLDGAGVCEAAGASRLDGISLSLPVSQWLRAGNLP